MNLLDFLRSALVNLRRRKLRTFLTVLAVVIGAALISLLVSLGLGAQEFISAQVRAIMPSNVIMVAYSENVFELGFGGPLFSGGPQEIEEDDDDFYALRPLTAEEVEKVQALEHVERTDPYVILAANSVRLKDSNTRFRTQVTALPDYQVQTRLLVAGQYFDDQSRGQCIITKQYLEPFGFERPEDALGQEILIRVSQSVAIMGLPSRTRDFEFTITGVAEKTLNSREIIMSLEDGKEISRFWTNNPDLYTDTNPPSILLAKIDNSEYIEQVADEIENLDLGALTSEDVLGFIGTIFRIIQAVLGAFGLIALGVASLGIINTLIMAIYERTREIGVMKAVGASKTTIHTLFTVEGAAIGFIGGIIGVGIGYGIGFIINSVSHRTFLRDFELIDISLFPWWLILGVIALSTIIAVVASLYPAHRASQLNPVDALRYE